MCGIVGFWDSNNELTDCDLKQMTDRIVHRGHDAEGFFFQENIALGHRRLSIIDTSNLANQPMYSSCGRYVLVFNGEIYNFLQLKRKITTQYTDYQWKTKSDTEVVLMAFICFGERFVEMLEGMFTICIFDKKTRKMYIYRDRVGIKPLFYYYQNGLFAFSSEIKALLALSPIKNNLTKDTTAINHFLYLGYIPSPNTIYNEIKKFPAASYLMFDGQNMNVQKYWQLPLPNNVFLSNETIVKKELKSLLEQTIEKCMISDVSFGCFLSGGIDSSLVCAIAQHLSDKQINTFSIGFEDVHNEANYAKKVARYLGTNHHEMYVKEVDAIALIEQLLTIYDEPYGDSSALPTLLLSQMTKKHVTMAISGDGGDELFLGYGTYTWAKRLNNPFLYHCRKPLSYLLSFGGNREKKVAKLLDINDKNRIKSHIFSQEQFCFSQNEIVQLLKNHSLCYLEENQYNNTNLSAEEQQSCFDFQYYLPDDLLVKVDRASMYHSLEVRVPLLEYPIVEYAFNLDKNLRKKNKNSKYILKEVLYNYVPASYFNRPKWGFSIPLQRWLQKDLHYLIDTYLHTQALEEQGIYNINYINQLINRFDKGETYLYNRLWLLIVLQIFLRNNSI